MGSTVYKMNVATMQSLLIDAKYSHPDSLKQLKL